MSEILVGAVLAAAVGLFAQVVGFHRERSFYPVVLIVIALLYLLYAAIGGSSAALLAESLPAAVFIAMAVAGFRGSPWIAAAGLVLHGLFDLIHGGLIVNPGVPPWWPGFCGAYDVVAGSGYALLLLLRRGQAARRALA